jgi:riboflavin synthase
MMMTSSVASVATLRSRSSAAMRGGGVGGAGRGARVSRPGGGCRRAGGDGDDGGRRARRRMRGAPRALFTGLVQGKARVEAFETLDGEFARLTLGFPSGTLDGIRIGASVAVNGTCLTVTRVDGVDACVGSSASKTASFDLIVETLRATNLGKLQVGGEVNYERSARVGDEIGGHTVSGHVHCTAAITAVEDTEHNRKVVFKLSDVGLIKYVLPKGFISVDGCSLTVGEVNKATGEFNVWLIPETLRVTVLGNKSVGDDVNLEIESQTQVIVDTIERYMAERGM